MGAVVAMHQCQRPRSTVWFEGTTRDQAHLNDAIADRARQGNQRYDGRGALRAADV